MRTDQLSASNPAKCSDCGSLLHFNVQIPGKQYRHQLTEGDFIGISSILTDEATSEFEVKCERCAQDPNYIAWIVFIWIMSEIAHVRIEGEQRQA